MRIDGVYKAWLVAREMREAADGKEEREATATRETRMDRIIAAFLSCSDAVQNIARMLALSDVGEEGERSCWKRERAQNNFYELFNPRTPSDVFKRRMRMTRESFESLLDLVREDLAPRCRARRDFCSPRRTLCITLTRLAHGTSFLQLSETFAIGVSTAHRCYNRGVHAICALRDRFIMMPSSSADIEACIDSFACRGFPNACLAVDGCHVAVELTDQYNGLQDFICYKGYYSLNNIAYVDGKGMFKAVLCGWAGSSADGGVIKEMDFTRILQVSGELLWT